MRLMRPFNATMKSRVAATVSRRAGLAEGERRYFASRDSCEQSVFLRRHGSGPYWAGALHAD